MVDYIWELQGTSPTTIDDDDILQFAGPDGFNSAISVGEYNDTTHVKTALGANKSSSNTPKNNKFISQAGGTGGDSQVSVNGGATVDLDTVSTANAALHIQVTNDTDIEITDAIFYSYDRTTPATPTSGLRVKVAEVGDSNFTQAEGSASALTLADQTTPDTEHDYYIVISKGLLGPGLKQDRLRYEATIS